MLGQISSKPGVLPMLGQIPSKPGVSPVLGQISGQRRSFASARANSRPGGGATPVLGQISGQRRGFASARAKFRARARAKGSKIMESYVPSELLSLRELCITRKIACGAFPAVISFLLYSERRHSAPRYLFLLSLFCSATWC